VTLSGDAAPGFAQARARLELAATALRVAGTGMAAEPIGPFDLRFAGDLAWSAAERRIRVDPASLVLPGGATVALDAGLELRRGLPFTLAARADGVDYLRTVSALPPALSLPPEAPQPQGTLDARASLAGSLLDPAAWRVDANLDLSRMRGAARRSPPVPLLDPFVQHAQVELGPPHEFVVGPANPAFVPISELPRHVIRAVTASEDAGFFGHSGFDFEELRNAAVEGAEAGHVIRGGSTITQQLAKNLYLSREKTLARKLREALITVALESTVPKQRLMEIYLNVAEWGPGLWGIGPAARHWFGKDARTLTPREAAFLATVIPNPVRYHYMWTRGTLSEAWEQRVDDLLRTMSGQGSLTDDELSAALEEPIVFARPAAAEEAPPDAWGADDEPADSVGPLPRAGAGRKGRSLVR
jgi:penicillin-binding protein 1A